MFKMDCRIALLAVLALHAISLNAIPQYSYPKPACICPWRAKPVCGTDGNTYRSECKLYCENYKNGNDVSVANNGPCPEKVHIANPNPITTCSCADDSNVVCASDGNTYANACDLNCATATNPRLRLEYYGQCKDSVKEAEGCYCPSDYKPICGSDGNTYPNLCSLLCQRSSTSDINIANEGPCAQTNIPSCSCPKELIEVCGSDGVTYTNPCELNCATAQNSMLRMSYFGKCDNGAGGVNIVENAPCVCTEEYKPVCGTDGKTYPNKCTMLCPRGDKPNIELANEGPCPNEANVANCVCEEQKLPVCGSDGITYGNPCLLNCATINNSMLRIAQFGKCDSSVKVAEPIVPSGCTCQRELAPVCGSDGNTYNNECLMRCAGSHVSFIKSGRCDSSVMVAEPIVPSGCGCPRELAPVCGSDGNTYNNECLMRCAGAHVSFIKSGRCDNGVKVEESIGPSGCTCQRELAPVCGSDGNTYNNECLMRCAGAHVSFIKSGRCDNGVKVEESIGPSGCTCQRELAPVCGSDGNTYNNECLMRCAGEHVSFVRSGQCDPEDIINIRQN